MEELHRKISVEFLMVFPAPISAPHTALRDSVFRGYSIPRDNCLILGNLFAVHRDPGLFPDPETFNPSRFIDSDGSLLKNDSVIPFSMGTSSFSFSFFTISLLLTLFYFLKKRKTRGGSIF